MNMGEAKVPEQDRLDTPDQGVQPTTRKLSLGARLALGFGLVALLFLAANYFSHRNAALVTAQIRASTQVSDRFHGVAQSLTTALAEYRTVVLSTTMTTETRRAADRSLIQAVKDYEDIRNLVPESLPVSSLNDSIHLLQRDADALLATNRRSSTLLNEYWTNIDRLHQELIDLAGGNWGIGDRVVTRRSASDVANALLEVRNVVSAYLAAPSAQRATEIAARELQFLTVLDQNAGTLSSIRSDAWLQKVRDDFARLRQRLNNIRLVKQNADRQAAAFAASVQSTTDLVRATIAEPATQALARAATSAGETAQRTDRQVAIASIVILALIVAIAFLTVASITVPVARLTQATRRLAGGDDTARAMRGGMRELDQLAAAFNDMADRLAIAQRAMRDDQTQLEERVAERTEQLQHLAYHDTLTQLPNRRHLFQHLSAVLDQARTSKQGIALLLFDLDNFKALNDSLGHLFGDRVLKAVSERLANAYAQDGFVARLAGDEFAIVRSSNADFHDLARDAEILLGHFQLPLQIDDHEIIVTLSIGASAYPLHATDTEALLRAADVALAKAKELGRNRACVASEDMLQQMGGRFKTEQALRRATQLNELELLFQPQLSLPDGSVTAVEALLRWKHGGRRILPMEFLPLAEQTGILAEITDWVLNEAIRAAAEWQRTGWPQASVAVNISAQQFIDQAFIHKLKDLLDRHGVTPASLELELTETVLQSGMTTVNTLRELRALGVGIALDDFGAGYSSLASLEQLDLSRVKIDRSLVANVNQDPRSASIARAMIELCRSLHLNVTVEGIERREQLDFLRHSEGIDVQGYLFSQPIPADQVLSACRTLPGQLKEYAASSPPAPHISATTVVQWRGPPRRR
jgi:diguanylate cyclase (GGDEF)-like protein